VAQGARALSSRVTQSVMRLTLTQRGSRGRSPSNDRVRWRAVAPGRHPIAQQPLSPSYFPTTPALARVQGLPSNSSLWRMHRRERRGRGVDCSRRFLAGVAAVCDRRCLSLEWFRRSQTAATSAGKRAGRPFPLNCRPSYILARLVLPRITTTNWHDLPVKRLVLALLSTQSL
jgi:hypothetical protein